MKPKVTLTRQTLRTPRVAAVAGILFAVLLAISVALIWLALPLKKFGTAGAEQF